MRSGISPLQLVDLSSRGLGGMLAAVRSWWRQLDPRRRAIRAALISAALVTPLGVYLAALEWSQWNQYPSLGRWVFPLAGLFAFALPYLVVAMMISRRSASAGFATVCVAWCFLVAVTCLLSVPAPYAAGWILIPLALAISPPTVKAIALAAIVALVAFYYLQSVLIREGRALRPPRAARSAGPGRGRALVVSIPISYVLFWIATLAVPERVARTRRAETERMHAATRASILARARRAAGPPLENAWQADPEVLGKYMGMNPGGVSIVADSASLYVAANEGLVAVDRSDGHVLWHADSLQSRTPFLLNGPSAHGAATVLATDTAGNLYAVAAADGRVLWRLRLVSAWHWESPAPQVTIARDGSMLVGALRYDEHLAVPLLHVDATGNVRWQASIGSGAVSPAVTGRDGRVYAVGRGGTRLQPVDTLYAIGADGMVAWRRPLATGSAAGNIAIDGRGEIVVAGSDHVRIFSAPGIEVAQMAPATAVYAAQNDGLLALDSTRLRYLQSDEQGRWTEVWLYAAPRLEPDEKFVGDPVLAPNARVIAGTTSRLVVLRLSDGRLIGEYAPVVGVDDSGRVERRFRDLSAPARGPDGTIYVADERTVYGLRDTAR